MNFHKILTGVVIVFVLHISSREVFCGRNWQSSGSRSGRYLPGDERGSVVNNKKEPVSSNMYNKRSEQPLNNNNNFNYHSQFYTNQLSHQQFYNGHNEVKYNSEITGINNNNNLPQIMSLKSPPPPFSSQHTQVDSPNPGIRQPPPFNTNHQFSNSFAGSMPLGHQLTGSVPSCSEMNGFSAGQIRLCQLYPEHVSGIMQAARLAAEECQHQFSSKRWNCSLTPWGNHSSLLVPPAYMNAGSKEASVVKAFFSAAISYTAARACREGLLGQCSCSRRQKPKDLPKDWVWGGCGDNTEYGFMFGVAFVDSKEREMNHPRHSKELLIMLSNLHNNLVGRRIVVALSKPGCKCHGVSGSCSLKTCWHQLPSFRSIGQELKLKYESSSAFVRFNNVGTNLVESVTERIDDDEQLHDRRFYRNVYDSNKRRKNSNVAFPEQNQKSSNNMDKTNVTSTSRERRRSSSSKSLTFKKLNYRQQQQRGLQPEFSKKVIIPIRKPPKSKLVYSSASSNFCEPSEDGSWSGTKGRPCKRGSSESDGCDLMCCGRGYNTFRTRTVERCMCQFVWCCHVQCSSCEKYVDVHVCK